MRKDLQGKRFPESSLLFQFCLAVLKTRRSSAKVHDQDVGDILGFNPSDTSQWKRGKKAVRSVQALERLARVLDVDFETLHDLSDGSLDFDEAWAEFLEAEESRTQMDMLSPEQRQQFHQRESLLEAFAEEVHRKANITTVPVYVPEILESFPFIQASASDVQERLAWVSRIRPGNYLIRFRKGEMRAHTRVGIVTEIARVLLTSERGQFNFPEMVPELLPLEVKALAKALLVPASVLRMEFKKQSPRVNTIRGMAEVFWVPKFVIRSRMVRLLTEKVPEVAWTQLDTTIKQEFLAREVVQRVPERDAMESEEG